MVVSSFAAGLSAVTTGAVPLTDGWRLMPTDPGQIASPTELGDGWAGIAAPVPGTAASALQAAGQWDLDSHLDFDAKDWWYRTSFAAASAESGVRALLHFEGLATLAEVWLNGQAILTSDNMFRRHSVDVTELLRPRNDLMICFRALAAALARRRPRPRWKTKLVNHQQLRWFRTTLLGRIPGWSPPIAPVGPWRAVSLDYRRPGALTGAAFRPYLEGDTGVVEFSGWLSLVADARVAAQLVLDDTVADLHVERGPGGYHIAGQVCADDIALWWPHTHGAPTLHRCSVRIAVDGDVSVHEGGAVGFRRVEVDADNGNFAVRVNGVPVFCRGACWTVNDIVSLTGSPVDLSRTLEAVRQAGGNMLRVGGTMLYEADEFYRQCDRLGILVWQDFMFANMDYPIDDEAFSNSVQNEVGQQLLRLRGHPCVAVYCGNSEVEQQAAMLGVAREFWRSPLFATLLPELCDRFHPDVPYVPSTPSGGVLPFHVGTGITHYYGVGAYCRPIAEARRADVRFTPECLGFANVPEPDLVEALMHGETAATHDPRWKHRTPRDTGAGWDFEDVRDHYLRDLYGLDPVSLRRVDPVRYLDLGRVTTGEVMAQLFSEWRSSHSNCGGGLVWFLKDLWPGAGWGILDSRGHPKACFYYLQRAWQPRSVVLTDEGLDGMEAHVVNEADRPFAGTLELMLLRDGRVVIARGQTPYTVAPRSTATFSVDGVLDGFYDVSYVYRFGPPKHDVVVATVYGDEGEVVGEAFRFPAAMDPQLRRAGAVSAEARPVSEDAYVVTLSSDRFLYGVHFDAQGFLPSDSYFHLVPDRNKVVILRRTTSGSTKFRGYVEALNIDEVVRILVRE